MNIKFIRGYRGWATNEEDRNEGTIEKFPDEIAQKLIDDNHAIPWEVKATSAAITTSLKLGVKLAKVKGTGSNGQITVKDVREFAK